MKEGVLEGRRVNTSYLFVVSKPSGQNVGSRCRIRGGAGFRRVLALLMGVAVIFYAIFWLQPFLQPVSDLDLHSRFQGWVILGKGQWHEWRRKRICQDLKGLHILIGLEKLLYMRSTNPLRNRPEREQMWCKMTRYIQQFLQILRSLN